MKGNFIVKCIFTHNKPTICVDHINIFAEDVEISEKPIKGETVVLYNGTSKDCIEFCRIYAKEHNMEENIWPISAEGYDSQPFIIFWQ